MAVKVFDITEDVAVGRYFESNALGFLSNMRLTAASLVAALSGLFSQDTHRHDELHVALAAKHWQYLRNTNVRTESVPIEHVNALSTITYNFKHFDFLQLQVSCCEDCSTSPVVALSS